jgi:hypothetical protein
MNPACRVDHGLNGLTPHDGAAKLAGFDRRPAHPRPGRDPPRRPTMSA